MKTLQGSLAGNLLGARTGFNSGHASIDDGTPMPSLQVISLFARVAGLAAFICRCTIWAAPILVGIATPGLAEKGKLRERLTPDVMEDRKSVV